MKIRKEKDTDIYRIEEITIAAFKDHPHGEENEHLLVNELRNQGALAVSLVAEIADKVVGHIAFSRISIDGKNLFWYGLGPVSVDPEYQNQGIGSKLVIEGLETIKKMGATGCVLVGEPDYYGRFGFTPHKLLKLTGIPSEYFLALPFTNEVTEGEVKYHEAFSVVG